MKTVVFTGLPQSKQVFFVLEKKAFGISFSFNLACPFHVERVFSKAWQFLPATSHDFASYLIENLL